MPKKWGNDNMIKVALYPRVSSHEQVEGYSIGEQIERLTKYCEAMGWEIYKIYTDPGYSGGNTERPGLQEMLKDIKAGKVDKVVVYKLDRLSRSQKDTMMLIEDEFLAHGVDFVSMSENFDTSTPFGRAMIGILAVFAQLERENIKERTMIGKEARAKEGKWGGGASEPVGYDYDPQTEQLVINEYEAMQVKEAVQLFLSGMPLRTMSRLFAEKGYTYRGRSGKTALWEPKRFKYVFANKLYIGYMKYGDNWYPADHTPIIDKETFDKLQKLLAQRSDQYAMHRKKCSSQSTILGGMLYCKHCGGRYAKQLGRRWKGNTPPVYYCCYSRSKKVPKMVKDPNCQNKNWKMEDLDAAVLNEIRKLQTAPDYFHELRREKAEKADGSNKIDILKNEIAILEDKISRFMDLYGLGQFTIDQISSKIEPLNEQKKALENELEALNAEAKGLTEEETKEILSTFDAVLNEGELDKIRLIIEQLIYYIEVDNDDVYIHWRFV